MSLIKRLFPEAIGDTFLELLAVAKRQISLFWHPELKQGRGDSPTVTRPAFIHRQLVTPSGRAEPTQDETRSTFGHARSGTTPAHSTHTERG